MRREIVFGCAVGIWIGLVSCSDCDAGPGYAVHIKAFPIPEAAARLSAELGSTTSPVFVQEDAASVNAPFKVFLGPYESYMDAWAAQKVLPASFPSDTFIAEHEERPKGEAVAKVPYLFSSLPSDSVLTGAAPDPASFVAVTVPEPVAKLTEVVQQKSVASMTRSELLAVGFHGSKNGQAIEALERLLGQNGKDFMANAARLRLSRRLLGRKEFVRAQGLLETVSSTGTADEKATARLIRAYADSSRQGQRAGFSIFGAIASDESLSAELRSHAMRIAAGHAHAAREYTSAVLAFRQLEAQAPSVAERNEASLQLCGIQIELVGRGKGEWVDAIAACERLAAARGISREIKATADLMRFESLSHAGRNAEALGACEDYLEQYADIRREYVSASVWYGVLLVYADRRDEAAAALKSVLELEIGSAEKFGGHEPKARAAYWLGFLALQRGDLSTRDFYVSYLKTKLPKSLEASKLAALQPAQSPPSR